MDRRQTSATTLGVLGLICVFMLVFGLTQATKGFPKSSFGGSTPVCVDKTIPKGSKVRTGDITVSVFNAGQRSGLASKTMEQLIVRGFGPGDSGNARRSGVKRVEVRAAQQDTAARLVAAQFGAGTRVVTDKELLGVGIVVVVGDDFKALIKKSPRKMKAAEDTRVCTPPLD
ncbi:LytR C-terminal domain-containing protein [Nocardioides sp. JQ2195]|uniref:LytR C-terminal domain-containing protein n=1 Tax=Nocardioides sp. JQ2195 TaxID=2592334 RepID=UPI00143E5E7A|nr:LytR C-terminal domain-containing protein [Nocardioides sp. JQ2195]QIX28291.1 LytR C-terminal domain-containing protein [Nocardioides sp. JQ2195]